MTLPRVQERKGSVIETVKAVLWGFLGVRRNVDFQRDVARLNPIHLLVAGVAMALVFVATLILIVNWVVG
jgi:hypothetical protein